MAQRSPSGRLVRLLILCFLVGVALTIAGVTTPGALFANAWDAVEAIGGLIWANADWILRLVALGAVIVVPLWLLGVAIDWLLRSIGRAFRREPRAAPPAWAQADWPPQPVRRPEPRRRERQREARRPPEPPRRPQPQAWTWETRRGQPWRWREEWDG